MNILELCLSPGLGGLELYVFRSARALAVNNNVIAVLNEKGKLTDYFSKHTDIKTQYLAKSFKHLPLLNARKLAGIIDRENIEALHMHWGNDLALAALAKKLSRKKPALVYTRQMKITRYKNDYYHRFLYEQMNLMLTITKQLENDAKMFIPGYENQIKTLYYGVNAPAYFLTQEETGRQRAELGFNNDDFVVGLLGRLEHGKGQHLLIDALHMARKENLNLKALIVGHEMKPGYRYELKKLAETMGVANNIVFMDFVPEPQKLMQLCDCIALTSFEETFGLVLPEAMRCGIAVIGSNKGGVPEIIDDKQTGLLFETKSADSLYRAIHMLYTNHDLRINLSTKGKEKADKIFNQDKHFKVLEQHLQNTISDI